MTGTESEIETGRGTGTGTETGTETETGTGSGSETETGTGTGTGSGLLKRLHGAWSGGGDAPAPLCPRPTRGADEQMNGMQGPWFYILCSKRS